MQKTFLAFILSATSAIAITSARAADEHRELGAHEHGVGALNIAFEGNAVSMELEAPGADIVGFEHRAESAADRARIDEAVAILAKPQELFVFPESAACTVTAANVSLVAEDEHHDEEEHAEGDGHDEEEHAEGDDHDEEEHAEGEGHDDHEDEAGHTEFHAEYQLTCDNPEAADRIEFAYFAVFENARELEVQMISDKGTAGFEVERDAPVLDLSGQI